MTATQMVEDFTNVTFGKTLPSKKKKQHEVSLIFCSFDTAIHPVLTLCGHLFWYVCAYRNPYISQVLKREQKLVLPCTMAKCSVT